MRFGGCSSACGQLAAPGAAYINKKQASNAVNCGDYFSFSGPQGAKLEPCSASSLFTMTRCAGGASCCRKRMGSALSTIVVLVVFRIVNCA